MCDVLMLFLLMRCALFCPANERLCGKGSLRKMGIDLVLRSPLLDAGATMYAVFVWRVCSIRGECCQPQKRKWLDFRREWNGQERGRERNGQVVVVVGRLLASGYVDLMINTQCGGCENKQHFIARGGYCMCNCVWVCIGEGKGGERETKRRGWRGVG